MKGFEVGERYDTMGLRGQRPAPPLLQRRPGAARERARRARRGLPDRDADPQQRPHRARHRLGRRRQEAARPVDRPRQGAAPVRPAAGRLRAGPGQDRLDGLLPVRARVDVLPDLRPGRRRRPRLLARVGDLQGLGDRVPLVRGQPRAAARRRRGLHARPSPTRRSCATSASSRSSRAPTTCMRAFIALSADQAGGREARGARRDRAQRPDRLDRRAGRLRRRPDPARGPPGPDHAWPTTSSRDHADAVSDQVKRARAASPRSCCASTSKEIIERQFQQKRLADSDRRHLRAGRGALARQPRSSRTRASSPRGRSATSPTPSARAPPRRVAARFDQIESNDDERMTAIAKLAYKRGSYGYALFED